MFGHYFKFVFFSTFVKTRKTHINVVIRCRISVALSCRITRIIRGALAFPTIFSTHYNMYGCISCDWVFAITILHQTLIQTVPWATIFVGTTCSKFSNAIAFTPTSGIVNVSFSANKVITTVVISLLLCVNTIGASITA